MFLRKGKLKTCCPKKCFFTGERRIIGTPFPVKHHRKLWMLVSLSHFLQFHVVTLYPEFSRYLSMEMLFVGCCLVSKHLAARNKIVSYLHLAKNELTKHQTPFSVIFTVTAFCKISYINGQIPPASSRWENYRHNKSDSSFWYTLYNKSFIFYTVLSKK